MVNQQEITTHWWVGWAWKDGDCYFSMGILNFCQGLHSKNSCPNHHYFHSEHHNSWIAQWKFQSLWEISDCWTHQQPVCSWNSWPCQTLLLENDHFPSVWKYVLHQVLSWQPHLPTLSWKHCLLNKRRGMKANTQAHSHFQIASTNSLL